MPQIARQSGAIYTRGADYVLRSLDGYASGNGDLWQESPNPSRKGAPMTTDRTPAQRIGDTGAIPAGAAGGTRVATPVRHLPVAPPPRLVGVVFFGLLALAACASPTPEPTPTVSVHDIAPRAVADLLPQDVYNCTKDRETERWERLSPEEQAKQAVQSALWEDANEVPTSWRRVWYAQGLSCWAVHASDDKYLEYAQALSHPVLLLPSWQLCIEESMGFVEGVLATSMFVIDIDAPDAPAFYSEDARKCFT